jgi:hypothetical protein
MCISTFWGPSWLQLPCGDGDGGSSPRSRVESTPKPRISTRSPRRSLDRAQDRVDEILDITLVETRIVRGDAVDKLGFDHRVVPTRAAIARTV